MNRLRLAFMGTPDFAVSALTALVEAGHELAMVYAQPPRPAGRGQHEQRSPVQRFAERRGIPVRTPKSLRESSEQASFASLDLDAAVVAAYGVILPKAMLASPRLGCLNIHASLLPRWRGAAPIQHAILAGDKETGVTIMQMDEGLDTGPMLVWERIAITPEMNAGALHDLLAKLGARLIVDALDALAAGRLAPTAQPTAGVMYAAKIRKSETRLDWTQPAQSLACRVRAFSPTPGAWTEIAGERVRVLAASVIPNAASGTPGAVLDRQLTIACSQGGLRLDEVQRAGAKPLNAEAFLRGRSIAPGTVMA